MFLLKVLSLLETSIRFLSCVGFSHLSFTFIIFHQIIWKLDNFLKSSFTSSYHHLALSVETLVLQRERDYEKYNGTLSSLSISVDPMFKLAYF
jgi:hypothetical protein